MNFSILSAKVLPFPDSLILYGSDISQKYDAATKILTRFSQSYDRPERQQ